MTPLHETADSGGSHDAWLASASRLREVRWALGATALFILGAAVHVLGGPSWLYWALYLTCSVTGGWEPGRSGLKALRHKKLDVDLLMVAAAIGAAAIGQVFDGALLIVIFATSGALEAVATKRTEDSVRGLLDLAPETATLIVDGGEEVVDTASLDVGDMLMIRPGERIGGDGVVIDGASEVDQATITGEPLPAVKRSGDDVFAGTVNGTGTLRVRVSQPAADTVIARIVAMVEEASASKARTQLFIERVEQRYSVAMVTATVSLFVVPMLFGADFQATLLRAMTFMIVASPCALVLSTMPPLLSAIATSGRHGALVKSAVILEKLGAVSHVAFDKTGTLTEGAPRLAAIRTVPGAHLTGDEMLALAASAELASEHPLARAIVAHARNADLSLQPATEFRSTPGQGIRAVVDNTLVEVGNYTGDECAPAHGIMLQLEELGYTAVTVSADGAVIGVLGLIDRVRDSAATVVADLATMSATTPMLLTGDNLRAAAHIATEVGITDIRAGLLPQGKVDVVRELEAEGSKLMLVGDGVNDAPAMAASTVGVAMGRAGSDLAVDTADVVITRDDLTTLPALITLARRARRIVIANLVISASFIAVLVTWDLVGHLPLPLGVAGHEGSTILVALNGLRLLRDSAWRA